MRRLTIEFGENELDRFREAAHLKQVEWIEALHFLKLSDEVAFIFRVKFRKPGSRLEELVREVAKSAPWSNKPFFEMLRHEKGNLFTYFTRFKLGPRKASPSFFDFLALGGYFIPPYEVRNGRFKVTYLGSPTMVRRFCKMVDRVGVPYRIVEFEDLRLPRQPMDKLTEKQQRVLATAYRMGYFDIPRKTSVEQLAGIHRLAPSTLDVELRRAERHLIVDALGQA
jgi:magnesium-transporting ATPase (P-type)